MMNIELWLTFSVASIILLSIPGPTILTVISYAVLRGPAAKVSLVAAVALGDATALLLSLLGLGSLLAQSAYGFYLVKTAGGLYLLYLGVRLFVAGTRSTTMSPDSVSGSNWRLFLNTYIVTALNPKGIVFFVAFLPQFIDTNADVPRQLWVLAITFVVLGAVNATFYAVFAGKARQLMTSSKMQRVYHLIGGSLLTLAGIWALSAKQL